MAASTVSGPGGTLIATLTFAAVASVRGSHPWEAPLDEPLRASEAQFHALVQNSSDIITLFDDRGTLLYQSPSVERLLGYRPEERIGRNAFDDPIVHPDDHAAKRTFFEAARRGQGTPVTAEFRLRHADGSWRDIEAVGQSFRRGSGMAGVVANYRDVTDRKKAEEELRRQAQLLRLSYDAIVVWRRDGGIEYWNRGAEQLYGFAESEALGRITHELLRTIHPLPWPEIEAAMREDGQWEGELRHRARDGREVVVSARHQLVLGSDGIERILETNRDITDRKRAEEALRESERRFHQLFEEDLTGNFLCTPEGRILLCNTAFANIFGFSSADAAVGTTMLDLYIDPGEREPILATLRAHGKLAYYETWRKRRDGTPIHVVENLVGDFDDQGELCEIQGYIIDDSDRKKAEEELATAKTAAEAATEAKSRFIAALSHELRTPLTPVVAALDLLLDDEELSGAAREHLELIRRNVALETRLIDDLLDVTRIAKGKLSLVSKPVDAVAVVRESVRICSEEASAKRQTVTVEAPEAPCVVVGDGDRLHQVFWNLIRNAVKFTPEGGRIALKCRVSADASTLVVEVSDTGRGIERDDLTRIFAPFEQQGEDSTGSFEGLGLGLSICKAVVELHGGRIGVSSQGRGEGTTFSVELPMAEAQGGLEPWAAPAAIPSGEPKTRRKLRILLVEDNPDTADVMATGIVFKGGHEVKTVGCVKDALAAIDNETFDLLLCDVRLPDGTGYDLMGRLVAAGSPTRGIVISGFGTLADKERSREAGFVEHLVKPVTFGKLLETLERVAAAP